MPENKPNVGGNIPERNNRREKKHTWKSIIRNWIRKNRAR